MLKQVKRQKEQMMKNNYGFQNRFFSWECLIAARYLVSKNRDRFLSVMSGFSFLGICLGVATLIIVMSVMGGFREELLHRIIGMKGHILVYSPVQNFPNDSDIIQKIKACKNVTHISPMIERQAIVTFGAQTRGSVILALSQSSLMERKILSEHLLLQNTRDEFHGDKVILGKRMAENLGISIGDMITMINPEGDMTPFGMMPRQQEFQVLGFFEVGMIEYDKNVILMPLETGQNFFKLEDQLTQIEIFTEKLENNTQTVEAINAVLPREKLTALGWKHSDSQFFQAMQIERNVMFLILLLIIIIASFNIVSGLVMLVKDKTNDIAILKTMGASQASLLRIFLMTGSSIGILGTISGVILGIVVTLNLQAIMHGIEMLTGAILFNPEIYFLSQLPYQLNLNEVGCIAVIAVLLSVLATIYPASRAAKLNPVEALKRG